METGGPVPIVLSVPVPAGGPQLVQPKAIVSPLKAPPQLIPVDPLSSTAASHPPLLSPLTTSPIMCNKLLYRAAKMVLLIQPSLAASQCIFSQNTSLQDYVETSNIYNRK